jgi:hypothetical protein
MGSREINGRATVNSRYDTESQSRYDFQFCDTCWSEAVTVVNGANLCRTHRKAYLGVTS